MSKETSTTMEASEQATLSMLRDKATRLRIDSVLSTTEAGSGHPTSCASAAEIMSALFFSVMRYDPRDPHNRAADIFVLSRDTPLPFCTRPGRKRGHSQTAVADLAQYRFRF